MKQFEVELEKYLECPSHRKKYKLLELEIDILRHDLKRVPDVITPKAWLQLLKMETKSQRTKLLNFLWINEKRAAALRKKKNERKKLALMPQPKMESADADGYGLQKNTLFMRIYDKSISRCYNRRLSYLDMYDKKDLVYLTPHCRTSLTKYDPNKIYIIGAMVDKSINKPLSSAKAKQEGIKMARLPLELLNWGPGSGKNLTLNQVVSILLDINYTRDWRKALSHVPTRKLKNVQRERLKEEISAYNNAIIKNKRRNYVNEVHHINV
ncbi:hypothetical protein KM043_014734 [Ampulex compressa]|nr:hypothetical protein KM043_014734 [Ampulex compressa]